MKKRAWKWALVLFAAMAAIVGGIFWDAHRRADAIFDRHERDLVIQFARIRSLNHSRAALVQPPLEGNGWQAYTTALDAVDAIPVADRELLTDYGDGPVANADLEALEAAAGRHAAVVAQLGDLLRTSQFQPDYPYEKGAGMDLPYVTKAMEAAKFLRGVAALRHAQGRDAEALALLLPAMRIGQDTGRGGSLVNSLIQLICETMAAEQGREILSKHQLKAADLERFAALLDGLEAQRPSLIRGLEVDGLQWRQTLVQMARSGEDSAVLVLRGITAGRSWRFLFSRRLVYAGALNVIEQFHADAVATERLAIKDRQDAVEQAARQAFESKNPIIVDLLPSTPRNLNRLAVAALHQVLLRVSVAIAWYESEKGTPPPRLEDLVPRYLPSVPVCPLSGQPLRYQPGKLWSVGLDGEDDGGRPPANADDDDGGDGDVVWTIKRK